jgi:AraC-like DNA-binding protein
VRHNSKSSRQGHSRGTLIRMARDAIRRHAANPQFDEEMLARSLGVSRSRLSHAKIGFRRLLNEARIRAALQMIIDTTKAFKCVAMEVGYRRTSDLDRWFRFFVGVTPTEYRHSWRSQTRCDATSVAFKSLVRDVRAKVGRVPNAMAKDSVHATNERLVQHDSVDRMRSGD